MADRHVRPSDDGWIVIKPAATRASSHAPTQAEAISRAVEIVANDGGGAVLVHDSAGEITETREVAAHARDTAQITTELTVAAAADEAIEIGSGPGGSRSSGSAGSNGAEAPREVADKAAQRAGAVADQASDSARTVADEASRAAEQAGDDVATTAKKVRGHTETGAKKVGRTVSQGADQIADDASAAGQSVESAARDAAQVAKATGEEAAEQVEGTAREVAGEARAAARRTAETAEATARDASDELRNTTRRAAQQGAQFQEEATSAADRVGQTIHAYTEAAAAPIDQLAAALNPVRVTGRLVNVVAVLGLRLVGQATGTTAEKADEGARRLQDATR
ncbi:DUF2188 domain-containing protein [Actinomycetospora termitidis]|uniref:DUF2188 domain-containing protein n=1 Tax=Actinomycetospora termitidis TaxID=3053470 RepID=A0ABT7M5B5_9PSEU|nr:DUF2188 domain-containing protein [Actinomycetospora sp. Odt1-22]MDL5155232.1 DUF2188 domain-containing protein [Actinomycetospora sp. Odt1-22]